MKTFWSAALGAILFSSGCNGVPENPEIVRRYEEFDLDVRGQVLFNSIRKTPHLDDLESALQSLRELTQAHPNNIPVHREYQDRMIEAGKRKELEAEYRARLAQERSPANLYLLARLKPGTVESEILLQESLKKEKDFYWGLYGLGSSQWDRADREHAKKHLNMALVIHPRFDLGYAKLAEILLTENDEEARPALESYVALRPADIQGRLKLSILYYRLGLLEEARDQVNEVLEQDPENRDGLYAKAAMERAFGQPARAASIYRQILDSYPQELRVHLNLGILYEENLKDPKSALSEYEAFVRESESRSGEFLFERIQAQIWIDQLRAEQGL